MDRLGNVFALFFDALSLYNKFHEIAGMRQDLKIVIFFFSHLPPKLSPAVVRLLERADLCDHAMRANWLSSLSFKGVGQHRYHLFC